MSHRKAFTLLELVVVVAIVLVMSTLAIPALSNTIIERSIYGAGVQLQQDMRLLQQYSITHREGYPLYAISLDPSDRTYTVVTGSKSVTRRLASSLAISLVGFSSPLSFDSMGRPSEGSTPSALSSDCSVLIGNQGGSKQIRVTVGAVMGRISVVWTAR